MKTIKGILGALAVLLGLNSVATWAATSHQTVDGEKCCVQRNYFRYE
ncbi:MAG: hypothetical protein JST16_01835 [Bdellovibrionales bacterium]|nr:hypothetical protein [Bdellovibrionales bacterium]